MSSDSWTETGITWNNKPASGTLLATIQGQGSGWVEWDISSQALSELAGDKILTLRIVSNVVNSTSDVTFNSKEATDVTVRPQLSLSSSPTGKGSVSSKILVEENILPEAKNTAVSVYPNPVNDVMHISLAGHGNAAEAQVHDISGLTLLQQQLKSNDTEINVSGFPSGLYFVKVFTNDDQKETHIKVIKK